MFPPACLPHHILQTWADWNAGRVEEGGRVMGDGEGGGGRVHMVDETGGLLRACDAGT